MADYLALDVAQLTQHLDAIIRDFPELEEDAELRADTLEGETDLHAILGRLIGRAQDAKFMAAATAERVKELTARRQRFERNEEAMRGLIFKLMNAARLPKVQLPEATLSIGKGRDRVEITDETRLPDEYWRVSRAPDKTSLADVLKAGKDVPGAELVAASDVLKVRVA